MPSKLYARADTAVAEAAKEEAQDDHQTVRLSLAAQTLELLHVVGIQKVADLVAEEAAAAFLNALPKKSHARSPGKR